MKNTDILQIIKSTGKSPLGTNSGIPLEYVYGLPVFTVRNSRLCMIIPFLKYKVTGQVDKTLVYPIRYTITVLLPEGRVVGYEDLTCNSAYGKVDFTKPVGFFRHEMHLSQLRSALGKNKSAYKFNELRVKSN